MNEQVTAFLSGSGVDAVRFVDISGLNSSQTQGYERAVLICLAMSKGFLSALQQGGKPENDEFTAKEQEADAIADKLADFLRENGYRAYSQSEESNFQSGNFFAETRSSRLPHKTIARLAGFGFIGKNNLLINEAYGCGFCMCSVLTDAPLAAHNAPAPGSRCGDCTVCKDVCPTGALSGVEWSESGGRDATIDVNKCKCALKCLVNCPFTLKYALSH